MRPTVVVLLVCCLFPCALLGATSNPDAISFHQLDQDVRIAEILQQLRFGAPEGIVILRNVSIVDPQSAQVIPDQTVIASGYPVNRILWVGKTSDAPDRPNATVIDGGGRFLAPGLVDMHIHSSAAAGWLLNLANGVTTVREMDGFPWLLRARNSINAGRMMGPVVYVAGTILNALPMEGYAVVPASSQDARRIVRQQAACGYDFIKVHNTVPLPMFNAITEQARQLGLDVVGHVPHDITVDHALHQGRMRTLEHLKGFLLDRTLEVSDEDFTRALAGTEAWIAPTLYSRLGYDRGPAAQGVLKSEAAKYVPLRRREAWAALLAESPSSEKRVHNDRLGARLRESQDQLMRTLVPMRLRWLAGTDAAGYSFNIMGFALLSELQLLHQAGLPIADVIRAATTEPAAAMRQPEEFGAIRRGMRADLVLLQSNPLEDLSAFNNNSGVMTRGVWLERARIDQALSKLAEIYAEPDSGATITAFSASSIVAKAKALSESGFVLDPAILTEAAAALRKSGINDPAAQLEALAAVDTTGDCALPAPME